jgi:DNA-binding MarR family transcriptional regulator
MNDSIQKYQTAAASVRRFASASDRILSAALRPHHLTLTQYEILALLEAMRCGCCGEDECRCDESYICQNDVGERISTTKGNVSGTVQRLVEDGLVSREMNPRNRRENAVRITAKGRAALFAAQPDYESAVARCFAPLDEDQVAALCRLPGVVQPPGKALSGGEDE